MHGGGRRNSLIAPHRRNHAASRALRTLCTRAASAAASHLVSRARAQAAPRQARLSCCGIARRSTRLAQHGVSLPRAHARTSPHCERAGRDSRGVTAAQIVRHTSSDAAAICAAAANQHGGGHLFIGNHYTPAWPTPHHISRETAHCTHHQLPHRGVPEAAFSAAAASRIITPASLSLPRHALRHTAMMCRREATGKWLRLASNSSANKAYQTNGKRVT